MPNCSGYPIPNCSRPCHTELLQAVPYQTAPGYPIPKCYRLSDTKLFQAVPYQTVTGRAIQNCYRLSHTKLFQVIPYQTILGCAKLCQAAPGGQRWQRVTSGSRSKVPGAYQLPLALFAQRCPGGMAAGPPRGCQRERLERGQKRCGARLVTVAVPQLSPCKVPQGCRPQGRGTRGCRQWGTGG